MNRSFAKATIEINGGRRIPAVIACCSKCGHTEKISANNRSGSIPPEAAANRYRANGWFIANREGKDICPKCMDAERTSRRRGNVVPMKKLSEVVNEAMPEVVVEPPREATKEDNRLIFAKLNDVYLDEKTGYSAGWSDEKVASDLGVPRAWVSRMREEHFGTASNEEVVALLNEGRKLCEEMGKTFEQAWDLYKQTKQLLYERPIPDLIEGFEKRLADLEKKYK